VFASLRRFGLASGHQAARLTSGRAVHSSLKGWKYLYINEMITHFYGIIYARDNVNNLKEQRRINLVVNDGL